MASKTERGEGVREAGHSKPQIEWGWRSKTDYQVGWLHARIYLAANLDIQLILLFLQVLLLLLQTIIYRHFGCPFLGESVFLLLYLVED